jgi:enterochelin esterase-like enzyme
LGYTSRVENALAQSFTRVLCVFAWARRPCLKGLARQCSKPKMWTACLLIAPLCCILAVAAPKPPDFRSTEIHADRSVTFRYFDPQATSVDLVLENRPDRLPMQKQANGLWTLTTTPLRPEIYGYRFAIDGKAATVHDPQNSVRRYGNDLLLVPGHPPEPWEQAGAPGGEVKSHSYVTKIVSGLPDNRSEFVVYTPPGYDPKTKPYPVLYLLHVWGDRPDSWTRFGQANLILDNLLAQGKIRPMVVVMPLSYGDMKLDQDYGLWENHDAVERNLRLFEKALITEVMPQVESLYNVRRDAAGTAILGASMGGLESMMIGLGHPDRFGWVGGESSALKNLNFDAELPAFTSNRQASQLVWMVCGRSDELLESNRHMAEWLRSRGQTISLEEPEGTHSYIVWREGLVRFLSQIF